jgi:hypothetical protein
MVPPVKRWHFAPQPDPERESRLLGFAAGNSPGPLDPDMFRPIDISSTTNNIVREDIEEVLKKEHEKMSGVMQSPSGKADILVGSNVIDEDATAKKREEAEAKKKQEEEEKMEREREKHRSMREKIENIKDRAAKIGNRIKEFIGRMQDKSLMEYLRSKAPREMVAAWEKDIAELEKESVTASLEQKFAEDMLKFWEMDCTPGQFQIAVGHYLNTLPFGFDDIGKKIHGAIAETIEAEKNEPLPMNQWHLSDESWERYNESDRISAINSFLECVDFNGWMTKTEQLYDKIGRDLEKYNIEIEKTELAAETSEAIEAQEGPGILASIRKIRFYSVLDYVHGVEKFVEAVKTNWTQRSDRYSSDIASKFGKMIKPFDFWPVYGTEIDRILDQQVESKRNEESNTMKEYLEKKNAKWEDLFGPGGEFKKFAGKNPNKTRGILDYAADHGFLYDVDEEISDHSHPIYGMALSEICSDWAAAGDTEKIANYFTALRGKNAQGREHEIEHGYKKEYDNENVPRFIELLEEEMDEHNLWAAAGVCKRAMERGLEGEVASWLFTTVMAKLRQYPELRKVTPVTFFDIIGKLSMYQTSFTLGWAKGYRKQLRRWARSGDEKPDESILEETELKHLSVIEREIITRDSGNDYTTKEGKQKLNRLVARVLAAQIVPLDSGGYINIFESRFSDYRKKVHEMFAATADPLKEDSDYANCDTEKVMLPDVGFKQILAYNSQFDFKNESWTEAFMTNIVDLAERMQKIPQLKEAYDNFIKEMRLKLDNNFSAMARAPEGVSRLLSTINKKKNKPAIASMFAAGLVSWNAVRKAKFADPLKEQLKEHFFDYYDTKIPAADKKPSSGASSSSTASATTTRTPPTP